MIKDFFRPSEKRTIGMRLVYQDGWTANGSWIIKSKLEPRFMAKLAHQPVFDAGKLKAFIDKYSSRDLYPLSPTNDLRVFGHKIGVRCEIKHESEDPISIWLNVYELVLFLSIKRSVNLLGSDSISPVMVQHKGEIIGGITPMKI